MHTHTHVHTHTHARMHAHTHVHTQTISQHFFSWISRLGKTNVWKWKKHTIQCCHDVSKSVSVTSQSRQAHIVEMYTHSASWTSMFLFFTGKEWTNMAAPWRAPIWSKKHNNKKVKKNAYLLWHRHKICNFQGNSLCQGTEWHLNNR